MMAQADFTVADVLAWARTKPADGRYDYDSSTRCALCCFLRETGRATSPVVDMEVFGKARWRDRYGTGGQQYDIAIDAAVRGVTKDELNDNGYNEDLWTYGKLVSRLEALCPETPITESNWAAIDAYLNDIEQVEV